VSDKWQTIIFQLQLPYSMASTDRVESMTSLHHMYDWKVILRIAAVEVMSCFYI